MEKKGYVSHRKDGRAFIFLPTVDRADASRSALQTLVNRFFDGSPRLLDAESARGRAALSRSAETAEGAHRGGLDDGMAADMAVAGVRPCCWRGGRAPMHAGAERGDAGTSYGAVRSLRCGLARAGAVHPLLSPRLPAHVEPRFLCPGSARCAHQHHRRHLGVRRADWSRCACCPAFARCMPFATAAFRFRPTSSPGFHCGSRRNSKAAGPS